MFRASSRPSSGATTTAVAASGLPLELGDSSAVGRGRASSVESMKMHGLANHKQTQGSKLSMYLNSEARRDDKILIPLLIPT